MHWPNDYCNYGAAGVKVLHCIRLTSLCQQRRTVGTRRRRRCFRFHTTSPQPNQLNPLLLAVKYNEFELLLWCRSRRCCRKTKRLRIQCTIHCRIFIRIVYQWIWNCLCYAYLAAITINRTEQLTTKITVSVSSNQMADVFSQYFW